VRKQSQENARVTVSIVGPGNLGTALAMTLPAAGYEVHVLGSRNAGSETKKLARRLKARLVEPGKQPLESDVVWITVPDDAIAATARKLAGSQSWKGKRVFHSSGALTSDELAPLRKKGASVASVHPMMTFVRGSRPQMAGVAFALEGDRAALRMARRIVEDLGGSAFAIRKHNKVLYHAFGSFASPLAIALMATLEQVAYQAGIPRRNVKPMMLPLLSQTLRNYVEYDAATAFSGPLVRGDIATVRKHLQELNSLPEARQVYLALARSALNNLPVKNRGALARMLARNR
jgi:predicted short-subunit dehydrogenase-like oxidoreductase (DUF2520 family)